MATSMGLNAKTERRRLDWPRAAEGEGIDRRALTRTVARWLTRALLALLMFVVAGTAGLGLYAANHAGRIYEGVSVAGVPIGGLSPDEARRAIEERFAAYLATPLTFTAGAQRFPLIPTEMGAELDSMGTIEVAFAYGRQGSLWNRSQSWADGLLRGTTVVPQVDVDRAVIDQRLGAIAPRIVRAPVDARIALAERGGPALVQEQPGIAVDLAATRAALSAHLVLLSPAPVPIVTRSLSAEVSAATLSPSLDAARAAVDAPLVLTAADGVWHVGTSDLARIMSVAPETAKLRVDGGLVETMVRGVAAQLDRDAVDATLSVGADGRLTAIPGFDARRLDVARTSAAVSAALLAGDDSVALTVARTAPTIIDDLATAEAARGEAMIANGLTLSWPGGRAELARSDLLRALTIRTRQNEEHPFVFSLDRAVVTEVLTEPVAAFARPAVDARFRIVEGRIKAVEEAKAGRTLDLEAGTTAVLAAFASGRPIATIPVQPLAPKWTAADAPRVALGQTVIAETSTYYGTASEPRRQNVDRAVELQHAWLVAPDGVFSYVENVGAVDAKNGFVTGFGIIADENGGVTTAPVIGGGICQVSTTIYQAAFWAGLAIEERYQHPYYLRSYGEAPRGLPGLDAMVNIEPDWALDLKFRNTTANWIAVLVSGDGENVTVKIVGTDPGWDVRASDPQITNRVPKASGMSYSESPELPRGQELLVETAEDGFDVTIERQVVKNGKVVTEDAVSSSYAPARNLTLRGVQ